MAHLKKPILKVNVDDFGLQSVAYLELCLREDVFIQRSMTRGAPLWRQPHRVALKL